MNVNMAHRDRMSIANTAFVRRPASIAGHLASTDAEALFQWVALNRDPLVAYWEGRIGTIELPRRCARFRRSLRPHPARPP